MVRMRKNGLKQKEKVELGNFVVVQFVMNRPRVVRTQKSIWKRNSEGRWKNPLFGVMTKEMETEVKIVDRSAPCQACN